MSVPFRESAVAHYRAGRAETALLSLGLPPVTAAVYALAALVFGLVALASVVRVPTYAPGLAVVVQGRPGDADGVFAAALLPADTLPRLRPGQAAFVDLGKDGERIHSATVAVESDLVTPDALPSRVPLGEMGRRAMFILSGPVAVAYAPLDPTLGTDYVGGVVQVNVEIGTRRVLALAPPFDRFLED